MRVIFYLHNLQINGSNIAALNFIVGLSATENEFIVSSRSDGPMHLVFLNKKICVRIEEVSKKSVQGCDLAVVNSLIRNDAQAFLYEFGLPFFQYVHEDWTPRAFDDKALKEWGWELKPWASVSKWISKADRLIFPAKYIADEYSDFETSVLYNPIDPESLSGLRMHACKTGSGIDIVNVGTINHRKNQQIIIEMCKAVNIFTSCRFFGSRSIRDAEVIYTNKLKQAATDIFTCDFKFNDVKYPLALNGYHNSVFLLTSVGEVLPCTIQEMMHMGIPVVAPNRFGIPEVITNGETGMLFDNYNIDSISCATIEAYNNYDKISVAAKKFAAEEFDLSVQSSKLAIILGV